MCEETCSKTSDKSPVNWHGLECRFIIERGLKGKIDISDGYDLITPLRAHLSKGKDEIYALESNKRAKVRM